MTTQTPRRKQRTGGAAFSASARRPRQPAGRGKAVTTPPSPPATFAPSNLPAISSSLVHRPPADFDDEPHGRYFDNKVVLCFEVEFTEGEAKAWVDSYNLRNKPHLAIVDSLRLALFVAQFDVENLAAAKARLLAASPLLGSRDIFAAVNDYTDHFDPCKQLDFKHLVTIRIHQGSREVFHYIKFVGSLIGKYVKAEPDKGTSFQRISLVVDSTLKILPARGLFELQDSVITTIAFNYVRKNLRCYFCFSYRHLPHQCTRPRPTFYNEAELDPGSFTGSSGGAAKVAGQAHTQARGNEQAAQRAGKQRVTVNGPLRHPANRSSGSTRVQVDNNLTQEQTRRQEGELHTEGTQPRSDAVWGEAVGIQPNDSTSRPNPPSPLVAIHSPVVANRSTRVVQNLDTGLRGGHTWVAKNPSATRTPNVPLPVASAEGANINAHGNHSPTIHADHVPPSLNEQEVVLNTPTSSQIHLPIVPFLTERGVGSSRKRLRLDPIVPPFNLNLSCEAQAEYPRLPKRNFRSGRPTSGWDGAGPSHAKVEEDTVIVDSQLMPHMPSTSLGNANPGAQWDLIPATHSGINEEARDAVVQYAWTCIPSAEGERSPFVDEPEGSS